MPPVPVDTVQATAFTVEYVKTYSDQFADVPYNYLPGGQGDDLARNYILMGTRADDFAYATTDVRFLPDVPEVRDNVFFYLAPLNSYFEISSDRARFNITDNAVKVNNGVVLPHINQERKDWKIVHGLDDNRDSRFTRDEYAVYSPHLFKVVNKADYDAAMQDLDLVRNGWAASGFSHAANFMWAFQNDLGLANATNVADTITVSSLRTQPIGWTHNVGAVISPDEGVAVVNRAVFAWNSQVSLDIVSSYAMDLRLRAVLDARRQEVIDYFNANPQDNLEVFTWSVGTSSLAFGGTEHPDTDLFYAFGNVNVRNFSVTTVVERDGQELWTHEPHVNGQLTDLYDFDHEGGLFVEDAAMLQAGYNTRGVGGHVFRIEANLNSNHPFVEPYWFRRA